MKMRFIGSAIIALALVPPGFWLSGFDFDVRGTAAAFCYGLTIFVYIAAATCPLWSLYED